MSASSQSVADPMSVRLAPGARFSIRVLAIIAVCGALYYARSLFLPIALAVVLSLTFSPVVKFGARFRIPAFASSAMLIVFFAIGLIGGAQTLATPFAELIGDVPRIGFELKHKLRDLRTPVESINKVEEEVEKIASGEGSSAQKVVIKQPGLIARAADDLVAIIGTSALTLLLTFFLMVSRDMFIRKVVRVLPTLSDKKLALTVAKEVEKDVSQYLLTVTIINSGLGAAVGLTLWSLGMPNPLLFGVLAASLNFLPYVGALVGILATAGVAIVSFDTLTVALMAPACYLVITTIEGHFVTPMVLGRRFSLNTVVILLAIAFWGFMWGPVGVLIAVPILIILKIFCDRVEGLSVFGEFLSSEDVTIEDNASTAAAQQ